MFSSNKPRIVRGSPPAKRLKRHTYRSALPELIRDFDGRCAYSMQHFTAAGNLEVDHFDPRLKKEYHQSYDNLFPASRYCNGKKSNHWPSKTEMKAGCRFLNPCLEADYGGQIFENPVTHELIGATPAAKWHIRICGLNAQHLVDERSKRTKYWKELKTVPILFKGDPRWVANMAKSYRELVEAMIPEIPPPPI
jgi:hypothetical protein